MASEELDEAVAGLAVAVDRLLAVPVDGLDRAGLARVLIGLERQRRRLDAVDQRVLGTAYLDAVTNSAAGLADLLVQLLRVDLRAARTRVARAVDLGPRRTLTGQPLDPILPMLASAMAQGSVSAEQADVVIKTIEALPAAGPAGAETIVEQVLVEAARHEHPRQLVRTAAALLARLDPDGVEPAEEKAERRRAFTLLVSRDGTSIPRGHLTAEVTALWQAVLDSLAAPQPSGDEPDPRTAPQRRHDAFGEAATRLLSAGTLPASAGVPVTVLATVTMRELQQAAENEAAGGLALLGHGQSISVRSLLRMAGDAQLIPVVLTDAGGVLAYGRTRRLASAGQRLALAARDGGCSFPGCDRPAPWTEVHHVREWASGGYTDLDNMTLLCRYHHRHFTRSGWQVRMVAGVPEWLPPAWLDPRQRPRRNTVRHRALEFRQPPPAA